MPELPEVERARRRLQAALKGERLKKVVCADDARVCRTDGRAEGAVETPALSIERALLHRRVIEVHRHGKYMWLEFDLRPHLIVHLGMSGNVHQRGREGLRLKTAPGPSPAAPAWPPSHSKLQLQAESGAEIAITSVRRFARLILSAQPSESPLLSKLGFDPLCEMPSSGAFHSLFVRRRGNLKALLLNQAFAAGIGNWLADEILLEAGILPSRQVQSLDEQQCERLRIAIESVIGTAVEADADEARFPSHWLFHQRWDSPSDRRTQGRYSISHGKVAGRTTLWVPELQS